MADLSVNPDVALPALRKWRMDRTDQLPVYDADGRPICFRPNYDLPGVRERVAREAFDDYCAANPVTDNVGELIRLGEIRRFERSVGRPT